MRILDAKIGILRSEIVTMFDEVFKQLVKGKSAIDTLDIELANDIIENESNIDKMETDIAEHCENFLAVNTPVADDLRLIMAINNINPSLERIADIIEKVAKYVKKYNAPVPCDLHDNFQIDEMYETILLMYQDTRDSFLEMSTKRGRSIIKADKKVNKINKNAKNMLPQLIMKFPEKGPQCVSLLMIVAKLERIGDLIKNIMEEITFCAEAKSIRHKRIL